MRLCTVADCLWDYFDHSEMKSRGEKGLLQRLRLVILDHEYIGKETNSLIDPDVEDAGDEQIENLPNVPIFRRGFNPSLLTGLNLDALSVRTGIKSQTLRDVFQRGRRLSPDTMRRLRASLEVGEDGAVSIAEAAPLPATAQRAARMARQLRTLQNALAKGKDFDLNGTRRPSLENKRQGPASLGALRIAVERHLTDRTARRFFKDRIGVFWSGDAAIYADKEREIALIEEAIALASGAKRSAAKRTVGRRTSRQNVAIAGNLAARPTEAGRKRRERAARKAEVEAFLSTPIEASTGEWGAANGAQPELFSAEWAAELCRAVCLLVVVFFLGAVLHAFPRQVEAAQRATVRRASPNTSWTVFTDVLRDRIEKRLRRAEEDRLRKRSERSAKNKVNHPSGGVTQLRLGRRALGNDDAQKVACEPDAARRIVNADEVAAAEVLAADEGEYRSLD